MTKERKRERGGQYANAATVHTKRPALTDNERLMFVAVAKAYPGWSCATGSGQRVTLASLYRKGLLERHAHRGKEGEADAAYEYRPSQAVVEALSREGLLKLNVGGFKVIVASSAVITTRAGRKIRHVVPGHVRRGDIVSTLFDTGAMGASILYGIVDSAGDRAFSVVWESGIRNRLDQGMRTVRLVMDSELTEARRCLMRMTPYHEPARRDAARAVAVCALVRGMLAIGAKGEKS